MANILFNLNNPAEDDEKILSAFISLIGNMCLNLRKLQKQKYLIESGTYNLIYILKHLSNLKFQMQAAIAIRKATACRVVELLDSFVANGLINVVVDRLNYFGKERFEAIEAMAIKDRSEEDHQIREIQVNA